MNQSSLNPINLLFVFDFGLMSRFQVREIQFGRVLSRTTVFQLFDAQAWHFFFEKKSKIKKKITSKLAHHQNKQRANCR
jgi:hypothetical protein